MYEHDKTEYAYKRGYEAGVKEFADKVKKLWANYDGYTFERKFNDLVKEMELGK